MGGKDEVAGRSRKAARGICVTLCVAAVIGGSFGRAALAAPDGPVRLELNKVEDRPGGCRFYLVLANGSTEAFSDFRLDLVVFGTDDVIARRFAVDISPVRAKKTIVKLFDVSGISCKDVGKVLLNDVLSCSVGKKSVGGCIEDVVVGSRADIVFTK